MKYHKNQVYPSRHAKCLTQNIKITLIYTQLIDFKNDDYHSAVTKTAEETRKLIETGLVRLHYRKPNVV